MPQHSKYKYHPDGYLVFAECFFPAKIGKRAGYLHGSGYERVAWEGGMKATHRAVWFMHHGTWPKCLDHINGITTDNRIENLRETTVQQNTWNRQLVKNNVTHMPTRPSPKKWRAIVMKDGKNHMSYHLTEAEALTRAREMRQELFGEYTR